MASKTTKRTVAGMGLAAAAAAAAAGAYYFYGSKNALKNRKVLKAWVVKAKGEVMEGLERLKVVTKQDYDKLVSAVIGKYDKLKDIDKNDLRKLSGELGGHWNSISRNLSKTVKKKTLRK